MEVLSHTYTHTLSLSLCPYRLHLPSRPSTRSTLHACALQKHADGAACALSVLNFKAVRNDVTFFETGFIVSPLSASCGPTYSGSKTETLTLTVACATPRWRRAKWSGSSAMVRASVSFATQTFSFPFASLSLFRSVPLGVSRQVLCFHAVEDSRSGLHLSNVQRNQSSNLRPKTFLRRFSFFSYRVVLFRQPTCTHRLPKN